MEAAQDELKRSSDAFTERVQQLSAKLQLVGRQIGDMEAKQRTLDDALRRRQLLPADLPVRHAIHGPGRRLHGQPAAAAQ